MTQLGRKPGDPLTPKRFSKKAMLEIKTDVGTMVWNAEYQGVPRAPEGNRVKRGWFKIVGAAPRKARRFRYWDKAGSDDTGDYTVGLLMAELDGIYYIEDVVRGQWSVRERQMVMLQTAILDALKYGKIEFPAEDDEEDGEEVDLAKLEVDRRSQVRSHQPRRQDRHRARARLERQGQLQSRLSTAGRVLSTGR